MLLCPFGGVIVNSALSTIFASSVTDSIFCESPDVSRSPTSPVTVIVSCASILYPCDKSSDFTESFNLITNEFAYLLLPNW